MFNLPSAAIAIKTRDEDEKFISKEQIDKNKQLYRQTSEIQKSLNERIEKELFGKRN